MRPDVPYALLRALRLGEVRELITAGEIFYAAGIWFRLLHVDAARDLLTVQPLSAAYSFRIAREYLFPGAQVVAPDPFAAHSPTSGHPSC